MELEQLFKQYGQMVNQISLRYTRNKDDAEDIVQDVFMKIHRKGSAFREESSVKTWIYRIAVNCCLDRLRSQRSKQRVLSEYLDHLVIRNIQSQSDCDVKLTIDEILNESDKESKEILFLIYAEGFTHREAADLLKVDRSTITKRISRFKAKTRRFVKELAF